MTAQPEPQTRIEYFGRLEVHQPSRPATKPQENTK